MKKTIRWILILVFLAIFCFSAYKLITIFLNYKQARDYYSDAAASYIIVTPDSKSEEEKEKPQTAKPESGDNAESVVPEEPEGAPIEIDFEALQAECSDVIAWIYSEDTMINYPVVQAADNDYYLHRMLDGSYSGNGTIFMDYLCASDFTSGNSIIYGHNMRDGSMFHSLTEYANQAYYDEHPVLYLLTPEQDYSIELFCGVTVPADGWPYVIEFGSEEEKTAFLQKAAAESNFDAAVEPTVDDRIITLSTCTYSYDNARYLVMGILTPIS